MKTRERAGFAIPAVILVIALLTASIAAGFAMVSVERRAVGDQRSQVSAFALAQQGLETYMLKRDSLGFLVTPPGAQDSVRITMTGGYADVVSTRLKLTAGGVGGLYVVRSMGVETGKTVNGEPRAVRTVAQLAKWKPAAMKVYSSWTALSGLNKNGNSGVLAGADACGDSAALAGVMVSTAHGYSGFTDPASGNPPIDSIVAAALPIDWAGLSAGTAVKASIVIPPAAWPSFADPNYYPVIFVQNGTSGSFSLPTAGRGTLIVQGNMTIDGSLGWDGVMMIGGKLVSNGGSTINGTIMSGLNMLLGLTVDPSSSDANGTKDYRYNSCSVARALASLGSLDALNNTWVDNWVKY